MIPIASHLLADGKRVISNDGNDEAFSNCVVPTSKRTRLVTDQQKLRSPFKILAAPKFFVSQRVYNAFKPGVTGSLPQVTLQSFLFM